MSMKYCGATLDLHGGGEDLIFPHHENEIAQSEGATGREFVRYWVHNGWVTLGREKMSKSTKKFRPINEVVDAFNPEAIRLYLMSTHYRSPIEYEESRLAESETAFKRLRAPLVEIDRRGGDGPPHPREAAIAAGTSASNDAFFEAMADDFNTSRALAALFDLSRLLNGALDEVPGPAGPAVSGGGETLAELGGILGLFFTAVEEDVAPPDILAKVREREDARKARDFQRADALRDEVAAAGWTVEDRSDGPRVRRS
jgi:cysteinyl-tRNA synthetase